MHRGPNDDDIIDRIRQPFPQLKLLCHSQIDPLGDCRSSNAHGVAMRVLLPPPDRTAEMGVNTWSGNRPMSDRAYPI